MLIFAKASKQMNPRGSVANVKSRNRLDMVAERISVSRKELNNLAKEVVGREFGDCSRLTEQEVRNVIKYIERNERVLGERYRKMRWENVNE